MKKAIVASSGGLDSTVCVAKAIEDFGAENVVTVSVSYGQKHSVELDHADSVATYYGVRHEVLDLSQIFKQSNCSLLKQSDEDVPEGSYEDQINKSETGVVSTYVPGRNALILTSVASLAQSIFGQDVEIFIYLGAHSDDAAGNAYPDCSKEFTDAIASAINIGTDHKVTVCTPLVEWNKAQVVAEGLRLHVPFDLTISCYNATNCACCGTCLDRIEAFRANGVIDPIEYAEEVDWTGCKPIDYIKKITVALIPVD